MADVSCELCCIYDRLEVIRGVMSQYSGDGINSNGLSSLLWDTQEAVRKLGKDLGYGEIADKYLAEGK